MQNWARFIRSVTKNGVLPIFHQPPTRPLPLVSAPDVGLIAAEILTGAVGRSDVTKVIHVEGPQRYSPTDLVNAFQTLTGHSVVGREIPRPDWIRTLIEGGLSEAYAHLVAGMYDAHNAGLIEVEPGGEIQRGMAPLIKGLATLIGVANGR
jgi:NAD(P)H dehydrogenase (quinone)